MCIFEKIMEKQIYNNNLKINYTIEGKGNALILIHGFLETAETWNEFSKELSKNQLVISVDLPGHGKSDLHNEAFSMCKYAESIYRIFEEEKLSTAVIIGHSMGGYVALAFDDNYPFLISGLCLFHSVPFADDDEKKKNRLEMIQEIKNGNKNIICSNHAKAVFADDHFETFKNEIKKGEEIAQSVSEEGIIASLHTMRNRNDRSHVLKECGVPVLYISGKKDRFISQTIINQIDFPENTIIATLENSGHMGMIEEKEKSLKIINDFCEKVYFK